MAACIALLRGINVGSAKRVGMADLKALMEDSGFAQVRTLLNSGNVVFEAPRPSVAKLGRTIEAAIEARFGFSSKVTVLTARTLDAVIAGNPMTELVKDHSRHLIGFAADAKVWKELAPLAKKTWQPDALAISDVAAYLWCVKGVLDSPLSQAFSKAAGAAVTTRNWATVLKLQALASA